MGKRRHGLCCRALSIFIRREGAIQVQPIYHLVFFSAERSIFPAHGNTGRPPQLCPAAAAPRGSCGRRDQRLPDGAARGRPLWPLQSGEGHFGQEGQPQR